MAVLSYGPGVPLGSTPIMRVNPNGGQYIDGYADPAQQAGLAKAAGTTAGSYAAGEIGATLPATQAALGGIMGAFGLGGSGTGAGAGGGMATGGGASPVTGSGGGGGVAPLQMPDMSKANAAAYAGAKDQVGQSSRAALTSLRDELGSTGALGGGAEVEGTRKAVMDASGELGQVSRDEAQSGANLAERTGELNYQGAIAQRGQDIAAQEAQARLALESRQQYMSLLQSALSGLKGMTGGAAGGVGGSSGMAGLLY